MKTYFPVLWLTGNTGSGKTTLARDLEGYINEVISTDHALARRCVVLDANDMPAKMSLDETVSAEDCRNHVLHMARLAGYLQRKGFFVVVSVCAPVASVRAEVELICRPVWVYIRKSPTTTMTATYEIPQQPNFIIDNDRYSIPEAQGALRSFVSGRIVGEPLHVHVHIL